MKIDTSVLHEMKPSKTTKTDHVLRVPRIDLLIDCVPKNPLCETTISLEKKRLFIGDGRWIMKLSDVKDSVYQEAEHLLQTINKGEIIRNTKLGIVSRNNMKNFTCNFQIEEQNDLKQLCNFLEGFLSKHYQITNREGAMDVFGDASHRAEPPMSRLQSNPSSSYTKSLNHVKPLPPSQKKRRITYGRSNLQRPSSRYFDREPYSHSVNDERENNDSSLFNEKSLNKRHSDRKYRAAKTEKFEIDLFDEDYSSVDRNDELSVTNDDESISNTIVKGDGQMVADALQLKDTDVIGQTISSKRNGNQLLKVGNRLKKMRTTTNNCDSDDDILDDEVMSIKATTPKSTSYYMSPSNRDVTIKSSSIVSPDTQSMNEPTSSDLDEHHNDVPSKTIQSYFFAPQSSQNNKAQKSNNSSAGLQISQREKSEDFTSKTMNPTSSPYFQKKADSRNSLGRNEVKSTKVIGFNDKICSPSLNKETESKNSEAKNSSSRESSPDKNSVTNPYLKKSPLVSKTTTKKVNFAGLRNLGNTCYLNSSVQMLFSINGFIDDLRNFYTEKLKYSSQAMPLTAALLDLADTISSVKTGAVHTRTQSAPVDPSDLKKIMDRLSTRFLGNKQRDAHEFISDLIDLIHDELEGSHDKTDEKERTKILPTDDYFRLDVKVCLTCDQCGFCRSMEEMHRCLSIEVGNSSDELWTANKGLEQFFGTEKREISCEKCTEGSTATQTMHVISRPKALFLHLKRFIIDNNSSNLGSSTSDDNRRVVYKKNKVRVSYEQNLSIHDFCHNDESTTMDKVEPKYSLCSVVHHIGNTANSGHYTVDAVRQVFSEGKDTNKEWLKFDDLVVSNTSLVEVTSDEQRQRTSYMLLYNIQ